MGLRSVPGPGTADLGGQTCRPAGSSQQISLTDSQVSFIRLKLASCWIKVSILFDKVSQSGVRVDLWGRCGVSGVTSPAGWRGKCCGSGLHPGGCPGCGCVCRVVAACSGWRGPHQLTGAGAACYQQLVSSFSAPFRNDDCASGWKSHLIVLLVPPKPFIHPVPLSPVQ